MYYRSGCHPSGGRHLRTPARKHPPSASAKIPPSRQGRESVWFLLRQKPIPHACQTVGKRRNSFLRQGGFPPRGKQTQAVPCMTQNHIRVRNCCTLLNGKFATPGGHPFESDDNPPNWNLTFLKYLHHPFVCLLEPLARAGKLLARSSENLNKFPISLVRFVIVAFPAPRWTKCDLDRPTKTTTTRCGSNHLAS